MVKRKNFSFYAPEDLNDKLTIIQASNSKISALSKSQAIYYIISELANKVLGQDDMDAEIELDDPDEDSKEGSEGLVSEDANTCTNEESDTAEETTKNLSSI